MSQEVNFIGAIGAAKIDKKKLIRLEKGAARNTFLLSLAGDIVAFKINYHSLVIMYSQLVMLWQYCVVDFIQTNPSSECAQGFSCTFLSPNLHLILPKVILESVGLGHFSFFEANDLHSAVRQRKFPGSERM